ncbi:DUF4198 domain-containing protein [Noviherbaspirillum denitrificans]|uniref:DUF4198 domain-containing protein n=1 Tax=Noviherbaspirillum denitrificans TaxID=1968433 RepID=A0A254TI65_9BURK|nr:DUF4198 domain-containing protein [Noviherbaspirillum denitrificans]OWW21897.1 hypothetical protein AYR66_22780 [Noviherbaspirillum denitrificans]
MKARTRLAFAASAFLFPVFAVAHEFWLRPEPFTLPPGGTSVVSMFVGEYFEGERIGVTPGHAASMRVLASGGEATMQLEPPSLKMRFTHAGTHVIAFDSAPSTITLSADKFHAYLHDEGLDAVIRQRERDGTAQEPGRERYRRHVKSLLKVGRSDGAYAQRTGQRLEILPLEDPLSASPGSTVGFRLLFDGQPLPDTLVKAWHRKGGQTLVIRARSDAGGYVRFTLPHAGPWMISTVHMVPAAGTPDADWDSFWGNLTFELARR